MSDMTHNWIEGEKPVLPTITDEELLKRASLFRHIAKGPLDSWYAVATPLSMDYLRGTSCIWDPKLGGLFQIDELHTLSHRPRMLHFPVSCGYYGFFKPSVAEVMAAIPDNKTDGLEALLDEGFNAYSIRSHCDIHKSGEVQIGYADFVRVI